jgi:hypothetical protein
MKQSLKSLLRITPSLQANEVCVAISNHLTMFVIGKYAFSVMSLER